MYYNKRLHPRQYVVEHHQDGCMLHELEEQSRITRYSSLSALGQHTSSNQPGSGSGTPSGQRTPRRRLSSVGATATSAASQLTDPSPLRRREYGQRPLSIAVTPTAGCDWSISVAERMRNASSAGSTHSTCTTPVKSPAVHHHIHPESDDSSSTTTSMLSHSIKPSLSRKTSAHALLKNVHFSRDCIEHSATSATAGGQRHSAPTGDQRRTEHDTPEQIIASLFPEQVPRALRPRSVASAAGVGKTTVARPGGVLKATKSSASRSAATAVTTTGRKTQLVASPGFGSKARARVVYRPDSLQELSRDFEGIKYATHLAIVCLLLIMNAMDSNSDSLC